MIRFRDTLHLVIKENPGIGNQPGLQSGVNVSFILYPLHDHLKGRFQKTNCIPSHRNPVLCSRLKIYGIYG
jgi:hypothetical protein